MQEWKLGRVARGWLKVGTDLTAKIDKKYAETLKDGLFNTSLKTVAALKLANSLKVNNREARQSQIKEQNIALANMGMAEEIVLLALSMEQITPEQAKNWQKHQQNLEVMTLGWIRYCNEKNKAWI